MRRRRIALVASCLLALCGAAALAGTHPAVWRLGKQRYPGSERFDLDSLAPGFRACVEPLLADLAARGWRPMVYGGWRDADRQRFYQEQGWSRTSRSRHAVVGGAEAVDLVDGTPFALLPRHASFFVELRDRAAAHGLVSGGTWERTHPLWRQWDLGWDPAHLEAGPGSCR